MPKCYDWQLSSIYVHFWRLIYRNILTENKQRHFYQTRNIFTEISLQSFPRIIKHFLLRSLSMHSRLRRGRLFAPINLCHDTYKLYAYHKHIHAWLGQVFEQRNLAFHEPWERFTLNNASVQRMRSLAAMSLAAMSSIRHFICTSCWYPTYSQGYTDVLMHRQWRPEWFHDHTHLSIHSVLPTRYKKLSLCAEVKYSKYADRYISSAGAG